jgi:phospholipid/cholesterol/gamma-HCH transport system ATP-binding protein
MIRLEHVKKKFGERWVLKDVTLAIPKGKMTVIVGRSGEGKSILLKQIIGLIKPTSGSIYIDNIDITKVSTHERTQLLSKIGYVFQFAALLDSLTVCENVGLPLIEKGYTHDEIQPIVIQKLALVSLGKDVLHKYPSELSGGMLKRVGLARTLVHNPEIILYDEPTTGLDPVTTRIVHELMNTMQKKLNLTSIVVSHTVESFKYADHVALLQDGTIQYTGDAHSIWQSDNHAIHHFIRGLPTTLTNPEKQKPTKLLQ